MRTFLKMAGLAAGLAVLGGKAFAYTVPANPVDVEVFATMSSNLQITISTATMYDFGTLTSNQKANTGTVYIDIQNTGGGLTQTYQLKANNSANWTVFSGAGNPGADQFAIDAVFKSTGAVDADFNSATDRLTTAFTQADGTKFFGDQSGVSTLTGQSVQLRLRYTAPLSAAVATRQRSQIDINAVTP